MDVNIDLHSISGSRAGPTSNSTTSFELELKMGKDAMLRWLACAPGDTRGLTEQLAGDVTCVCTL